MKTKQPHSNLFQQRFTLMMALLLCLFVSGLEYLPQEAEIDHTEQSQNPDQTFLNVAVDAVVPFVLHVSYSVSHLIYQVFNLELQPATTPAVSDFVPNHLVEILFERIISTQGP